MVDVYEGFMDSRKDFANELHEIMAATIHFSLSKKDVNMIV